MQPLRASRLGLLIAAAFLASGAWLLVLHPAGRVTQVHGRHGQRIVSYVVSRSEVMFLGVFMLASGAAIAALSIDRPRD